MAKKHSSARRPAPARPGKQYSVKVEDGEVVAIEIDGVRYTDLAEIPDEQDRAAVRRLIDSPEADEFAEVDREAREAAQRVPPVIVGIFGGLAGLLLAIAAVWTYSTWQAQARELSAPGQVVEVVERYSAGIASDSQRTAVPQPYYYPVVEFYTPDERLHHVQLAEGSWPAEYEKGQAVTVMYDPAQPLRARIQSTSSTVLQWIGPGILGLLGLCFAIAAGAVAWFLLPRAEPVEAPAPR